MKIYFVADFFKEDLLGGAESNDSVLIDHLNSLGCNVTKLQCKALTEQIVNEKDVFFIISNFISLDKGLKLKLYDKQYIIYEHDHKYLSTRDPSRFKDFVAPREFIVNRDFYRHAYAVVVLSDICKDIIEKNLNIDNVYSIGCSLWSDDKLDVIEDLTNEPKNEKFAIIRSFNPIKNTLEAIQYCEKNNIVFDVIEPCEEHQLLAELSKYKGLVFFPKVLETFSRISAEAKMLNCKLLTKPKLLGFASEKIFNLSGKKLISAMRERKTKALKLFIDLIEKRYDNQKESITVILNCYRRPEYLEEQIASIRNQSIKPEEIWLWINHHEDNEEYDFSNLKVDRIIKNDYNWKYYGRFAIAMMANTKYIALFDDDTIPGAQWFKNCLQTMKHTPGILGGAGVILDGSKYRGHARFGWSSQNEETVEVDLVGHAWFFKQEWLKYLWMEQPYMWDNGEDIQFSYCCQKYGDVKTYCPPHPASNIELFSSLKGYQYGIDEKASSHTRNHLVFYEQRDACVLNAINNDWNTMEMRNDLINLRHSS